MLMTHYTVLKLSDWKTIILMIHCMWQSCLCHNCMPSLAHLKAPSLIAPNANVPNLLYQVVTDLVSHIYIYCLTSLFAGIHCKMLTDIVSLIHRPSCLPPLLAHIHERQSLTTNFSSLTSFKCSPTDHH